MKSLRQLLLLAFIALFAPYAMGQQEVAKKTQAPQQPNQLPTGRFCVINALPNLPVQLSLNKELLSKQFLTSAQSTGQWPAPAGKHQLGVQFTQTTLEPLQKHLQKPFRESITLEAGKTLYLILFAEYVVDEQSGEEQLQPKLIKLTQQVHQAAQEAHQANRQKLNDYHLNILWAGKADSIEIQLNKRPIQLNRGEFTQANKQQSGNTQALLFENEQKALARYHIRETGEFLALLFDDAQGKPSISFHRLLP